MRAARCLQPWFMPLCVATLTGMFLLAYLFTPIRRIDPCCVKPLPAQVVTLLFYAYDTQGRKLSFGLLDSPPDINAQSSRDHAPKLELPVGQLRVLRVRRDGVGMDDIQTVEANWMSREDYSRWLDEDLPKRLAAIDPHYDHAAWDAILQELRIANGASSHEYPIIFAADTTSSSR